MISPDWIPLACPQCGKQKPGIPMFEWSSLPAYCLLCNVDIEEIQETSTEKDVLLVDILGTIDQIGDGARLRFDTHTARSEFLEDLVLDLEFLVNTPNGHRARVKCRWVTGKHVHNAIETGRAKFEARADAGAEQ